MLTSKAYEPNAVIVTLLLFAFNLPLESKVKAAKDHGKYASCHFLAESSITTPELVATPELYLLLI